MVYQRSFSEPVDIRGKPLLPVEAYEDDLGIFSRVASGVLLTKEEMDGRTAVLGGDINRLYQGSNLTLALILDGGRHFFENLKPHLKIPYYVVGIDAKSYGRGTKSSGKVSIGIDKPELLRERDVLIVEDIRDSSRTMDYVINSIREENPSSLRAVIALDKPDGRNNSRTSTDDVEIGYGHIIDKHYVFGYGLDAFGFEPSRRVPHLAVLDSRYYDPLVGLAVFCNRKELEAHMEGDRLLEEDKVEEEELQAYVLLLQLEKEEDQSL